MYAQTNFAGRVFMTHPTKAIYKMMLADFVKVSNICTVAAPVVAPCVFIYWFFVVCCCVLLLPACPLAVSQTMPR